MSVNYSPNPKRKLSKDVEKMEKLFSERNLVKFVKPTSYVYILEDSEDVIQINRTNVRSKLPKKTPKPAAKKQNLNISDYLEDLLDM
jgi:hypothetical protein